MGRLFLTAFMLLVLPVLYGQNTESYVYRSLPIGGGGFVSGIIYHPTDSGLVYCRTDVGGAYRWVEGERRWQPITDHLGRGEDGNMGVLSVALDPNDSQRVYLLTGLYTQSWAGTGAVLVSADQGGTWTKVPLSIKIGGNEDGRSAGERLQVDPRLGSRLFLGSSTNGLWKSENYGSAWTKVASFPVSTSVIASGGISFILFDADTVQIGHATQKIYVGVLAKGVPNLFRTSDGGETWEEVPGHPQNLMPHHAELDDTGKMFLSYSDNPGPNGISSGAVYKLDTNTDTWTKLNVPTGQGGFAGVAIDRSKPGTVMVSTMDRWWPRDEIYRSTDDGLTWRALLATSKWDFSSAPYASSSSPHWIGDIALDPFNSDKIWFVTGYGVWASRNITASDATPQQPVNWAFDNVGLEETVPLEIKSPPNGAFLVSSVGDIDGFRHIDFSVSPVEGRLNPRYGTNTGLDFGGKNDAFFARVHNSATGNYGAWSEDGGITWTPFATKPAASTGGGRIAVAADASSMVWRPGGLSLHYSTNKGALWVASTGVTSKDIVPVSDRVNPLKYYGYDAAIGKLFRSVDGGVSFTAAATGLPTLQSWSLWAGAIRTVPGFEGHIWLNAPTGLYHSDNSGTSFTKIANVNESLRMSFGKALPGNDYPAIYMAGTVKGVQGFYRSDDKALTWTRINDAKTQFGAVNDIAADLQYYGRFYLATGGRGIIYGQPLLDCAGIEHGGAYYDNCGTCVGGTTGLEECATNTHGVVINGQMVVKGWPNPFTNGMNLQTSGEVTYVIYAPTGVVLETGFCANTTVIGSSLSPGVYYLEVTGANQTSGVKIIKQ